MTDQTHCATLDCCSGCRIELVLVHCDLLDCRSQRDRWEIGEPANDQNDADKQTHKERAVRRKSTGRGREQLFLGERPGDGQERDDHDEPPDQHREPDRQVVKQRVRRQSGKRAAVIGSALGIGVENLAEAVGSGIGDAGETSWEYRSQCGPSQKSTMASSIEKGWSF